MLNTLPLRSDPVDIKPEGSVITEDDVVMAFKLILGRLPESETVIAAHQLPTLNDLRLVLLKSKEFAEKYKVIRERAGGAASPA